MKKAAKKTTADKHRDTTRDVQAGDDLPLVVVKGRVRPTARLQLGDSGRVYTVTKPKDMYFSELNDRVAGLGALVDVGSLDDMTADDRAQLMQRVQDAMETLREFVTCAFDPADHDEVLAHMMDNSTDEEIADLADAMQQCMRMWRGQV